MTLGEAQELHVLYTGLLINWCYGNDYRLRWGQTLREPVEAQANAQSGAGISNSLHLIKLAVDFSVFKNGVFLQTKEDYQPLGDFWKSLDPNNCWGGDFEKVDADHFSYGWEGVK